MARPRPTGRTAGPRPAPGSSWRPGRPPARPCTRANSGGGADETGKAQVAPGFGAAPCFAVVKVGRAVGMWRVPWGDTSLMSTGSRWYRPRWKNMASNGNCSARHRRVRGASECRAPGRNSARRAQGAGAHRQRAVGLRRALLWPGWVMWSRSTVCAWTPEPAERGTQCHGTQPHRCGREKRRKKTACMPALGQTLCQLEKMLLNQWFECTGTCKQLCGHVPWPFKAAGCRVFVA